MIQKILTLNKKQFWPCMNNLDMIQKILTLNKKLFWPGMNDLDMIQKILNKKWFWPCMNKLRPKTCFSITNWFNQNHLLTILIILWLWSSSSSSWSVKYQNAKKAWKTLLKVGSPLFSIHPRPPRSATLSA